MWNISSGADYRLTGDKKEYTRFMLAANLMMGRFNVDAGFCRAWNNWDEHTHNEGWAIIDCMMNLPILFRATQENGDERFAMVAKRHADKTMQYHVRGDGSCNHINEYDPKTGEFIKAHGGQGYNAESSWSRGQAWAVYGFALSYMHTKEQRYLDAAKQVANYFIACCCDDWIPRIDFRAPSEPVYYDTSAGCCAACGMIEIAKALPEDEGGVYMHAAIKMLKAILLKWILLIC
jgi:unsaturated chondroitin disaccharide hydrolase